MPQSKELKSLKERTISGIFWSSVHRFGTMLISFFANIVLARLLTPEDFGIIGMIMVFIVVSGAFVDGGFASALIQKKDPNNNDYSTIFYWNLFISLVLFSILFIAAPAIERFYQMTSLALILRIQGFVLILNAFNIIQFNQLRKQLNFKRLANIHLLSTSLGSITGIIMAFAGFGVWSLVVKILTLGFFNSIILWFSSNWRPSFVFSRNSFKELFGFGSFILMASIVDKVYSNVQVLIIGKVFSASDLGFYTQAKRIEAIPVKGLSEVVNQVIYPVFSQLQDNIKRMKKGISLSLKSVTFLNFPLMVLLIVVAKPLVLLLLTERWSDSIPYLQILCIGGMIYTLNTANNNIFKSLGKSDAFFYVQLFKRIIGLFMIILGLRYGLKGMLFAISFNFYLFYFISAFFSAKYSGYKIEHQLKDVAPAFIIAILSGLLTHFMGMPFNSFSNLGMLILQGVFYSALYLGFAYIFKLEALYIYYEIIHAMLKDRI